MSIKTVAVVVKTGSVTHLHGENGEVVLERQRYGSPGYSFESLDGKHIYCCQWKTGRTGRIAYVKGAAIGSILNLKQYTNGITII